MHKINALLEVFNLARHIFPDVGLLFDFLFQSNLTHLFIVNLAVYFCFLSFKLAFFAHVLLESWLELRIYE